MRSLKFNVSGQIVSPDQSCDFTGLVPGTKGYLKAEFFSQRNGTDAGRLQNSGDMLHPNRNP